MTEKVPAAHETTLPELRGKLTIPLFSETKPSYAGVMDQSKSHVYSRARRGDIPGLVRTGRSYRVSVPVMLKALGVEESR